MEAASQMIAHARAIGDVTLARQLLQELHATAAHSEEATPSILLSDVDESAIEALHEAVAANPRDPTAWIALARAHTERRDWHEGVLASFPAVLLAARGAELLLAAQAVHDNGAALAAAKAAAAAAAAAAAMHSLGVGPTGWAAAV